MRLSLQILLCTFCPCHPYFILQLFLYLFLFFFIALGVITPHACARGKVIGFVCCLLLLSVISTKIARSGDLGIWATRKYNLSVNIVEKLASVCFKSFGKADKHCKYCVLLATPMDTAHYVLSAHAHNLAQYVGKDRQQAVSIMVLSDCHRRCSACVVCAL